MNVVNMSRMFNLIPNLIFSITPLPNAALTLGLTAGTKILDFYQPQGKPSFDEQSAPSRQINSEEVCTSHRTGTSITHLFIHLL